MLHECMLGVSSLVDTVSWHHVVGVMLFLSASWYHHRAHVTFACLRTSKKGNKILTAAIHIQCIITDVVQ